MRGDHYVTLIVTTPTGLSKEAKELMRQFDEATSNSLKQENGADASMNKKEGFFGKKKK